MIEEPHISSANLEGNKNCVINKIWQNLKDLYKEQPMEYSEG